MIPFTEAFLPATVMDNLELELYKSNYLCFTGNTTFQHLAFLPRQTEIESSIL